MRSGQYGWDSNIDYFKSNTIFINQPAPVTRNYGVLNIGGGLFDGLSISKFVGSSNGTQLAVNAPSGYTGNLVDLQVAGISKLYIDYSNGNIVANNFSTFFDSLTVNVLRLNSMILSGTFAGNQGINSGNHLNALILGENVFHTQYVLATPDGANSSSYGKVTISTGTFSGSSAGTSLAVAEPSGFVGNLLDLQVNSVSEFKVDSNGNVTLNTPSILDAAISAAAIAAWGRLD